MPVSFSSRSLLCGLGRWICTGLALSLLASPAAFGLSPLPKTMPLPPNLLGHWVSAQGAYTIGLMLQSDGQCQLYTDRLTAPKAQKKCRYEYYQDTTYWVFLYDEKGSCSTSADFEFAFNSRNETVFLNIGSSIPVEMHKKQEGNTSGGTGR